jgi:hypothetical protein
MQVYVIKDGVVVNNELWEELPQNTDELTYIEVAPGHPAQIGYLFDGETFTWAGDHDQADPGRALVVTLSGEVTSSAPPAEEVESD